MLGYFKKVLNSSKFFSSFKLWIAPHITNYLEIVSSGKADISASSIFSYILSDNLILKGHKLWGCVISARIHFYVEIII